MPVRIYDIAKKLGIESKEVLAKAKALGIAGAKVPSSSLDKITAEYLEEQLGGRKPVAFAELPPAPAPPEPILIVSAPPETPTPAAPALSPEMSGSGGPVQVVGGELRLARSEALPIRSDFRADPIRALLGAPIGLGLHERAVQHPSGRPHERTTLAVLGVARLLADEHDLGLHEPLAEHGLRRPVAMLDWRTGKADPRRARKGLRDVLPELPVLRAMRLVRHHDHVAPPR